MTKLQWFDSNRAVETYVWSELLATLRDDLHRMEGIERQFYTTEDRVTLRQKIKDIIFVRKLRGV